MIRKTKIRQKIRFYGLVQGVGFRYTAIHAANHFGLTGWVFNDYDGTVLMEVQGNADAVSKMLDTLDSGHFIRIDRMEKSQLPLDEDERSFSVRY